MKHRIQVTLNSLLITLVVALSIALFLERKSRIELRDSLHNAIESLDKGLQNRIKAVEASSDRLSSRLSPVEEQANDLNSKVTLLSQTTQNNSERIRELKEPKSLELRSLKARSIDLIDRDGNELIQLSSHKGRTSFLMRNGDQFNTIRMNVFEDGRKAVLFQNEAGVNRMGLSTLADGTPRISLRGGGSYELEDGKAFPVAEFKETNSIPVISLFDAECNGDAFWTTESKGHNQSK